MQQGSNIVVKDGSRMEEGGGVGSSIECLHDFPTLEADSQHGAIAFDTQLMKDANNNVHNIQGGHSRMACH